jgi:hypothetical protein
MNIEQTLDKLTYLVYKDAGKCCHPSRKIHLEKGWWQFWKPSYRLERYEPSNVEKAMNGRKYVNSYVCINPYTSLIERIEKMRIRHDMGLLDEAALFELRIDVVYHCGKCNDYELQDFKEELLDYGIS